VAQRPHQQRSEPDAARQILEPLTRDSDQSVKAEAQELLESINGNRSGAARTRGSAPAVDTAMTDEPVSAGKSRMLGGQTGGMRDQA
jgi:hypothetical protein